ncbi:hypothetical protein, partial [Pseudomonas fluorescens]
CRFSPARPSVGLNCSLAPSSRCSIGSCRWLWIASLPSRQAWRLSD